jgi:hypothetical protein
MRLTFQLPKHEEADQANRFRTYLNYLSAISDYLGDVYSNLENVVNPMIESAIFQSIQGGRCLDTARLAELLRNAWFTEIQMSISAQYDEFVSYSNHWVPVQAYYSSYLALRSYFNASGQKVGREHSSNLKAIGQEIRRRPLLFPQPWRAVCIGNPETSSCQLCSVPNDVTISRVSSLTSSCRASFWDSYAMFLRTTRLRQLQKQCDDWKDANKRKRVSPNAKRQFISNLSPTTLFHCLYRLRLRSNYADADSFLLSVVGSNDGTSFHAALRKICWSTLLVLETLTARYIGKREFDRIVESFRRYERRGISDDLIGLRWGTVRCLW